MNESQRIIVQIDKLGAEFSHLDAIDIIISTENFIPDEPIRSIGGYGNFNFAGAATGDIKLRKGMRIFDNEEIDLNNPKNFSRLVREELTERKSGLLLTGKSREEKDDQFFFENVARRKAQAIRAGVDYVEIASIGNWEMIYKFYSAKASLLDRLMTRFSEKARVRFIAKYALPDWQKFLRRYFTKAGENPVPKYLKETFVADYAGELREITVIGYSLVLQF